MKKVFKEYVDKFLRLVKENEKLLLTSHVNADGDAIGSVFGMYHYLKAIGKNPVIVLPNEFPEFLKWIQAEEEVVFYECDSEKAKKLISESDLIVCLDLNEPGRLGIMAPHVSASKASKVLIDHHPHPKFDVDVLMSNTNVSSTAELVYHVIETAGHTQHISESLASALLAGIITDTGCFSYGNMDRESFRTISSLIEAGAKKDEIYSAIYDNYSVDRMRLMGYAMNEKMKVLPEFNTAYISLSADEMKRFNFAPGDSEGFVNIPFSIKGIKFTALFTETDDLVKISLRSKGTFSTNEFSRSHFDGGGHTNASGGRSKLSLQETVEKFEKLLPQYAKKLQ